MKFSILNGYKFTIKTKFKIIMGINSNWDLNIIIYFWKISL